MQFSLDRLYSESLKLTEFPHSFTKLARKGHMNDLLKLLFSIYKDEQDTLIEDLNHGLQDVHTDKLDYCLNEKEIEIYNKMKCFKEHLKYICGMLVDDIQDNFQTYLIQFKQAQVKQPHHDQVLKQSQVTNLQPKVDTEPKKTNQVIFQKQNLQDTSPNTPDQSTLEIGSHPFYQQQVSAKHSFQQSSRVQQQQQQQQQLKQQQNIDPQKMQFSHLESCESFNPQYQNQHKMTIQQQDSQEYIDLQFPLSVQHQRAESALTQISVMPNQMDLAYPQSCQVRNSRNSIEASNSLQSLHQHQQQTPSTRESRQIVNSGSNKKYYKNLRSKHTVENNSKTRRDSSYSAKKKHKMSFDSARQNQYQPQIISKSPSGRKMNVLEQSTVSNSVMICSGKNGGRNPNQTMVQKIKEEINSGSSQFNHFKNQLEQLKGRQKTDALNTLVYSSFSQQKGPQTFQRDQRFKISTSPSPGPAYYNINQGTINGSIEMQNLNSSSQSSKGSGHFNQNSISGRFKRGEAGERSVSPGPGAYNPHYHYNH